MNLSVTTNMHHQELLVKIGLNILVAANLMLIIRSVREDTNLQVLLEENDT